MAEILVVDDEIGIRELLSEILGDEGHTVLLADSAREARRVRSSQRVDLVLLDIWMPDTDGMTLLREWASGGRLTMPVIMMSGHATIDTAAEASRIGAVDFLEKPITLQKLLRAVECVVRDRGGRLLLIETSDQGRFERTRSFYRRHSYDEVARIPDYFSDGDGKVSFVLRIAAAATSVGG